MFSKALEKSALLSLSLFFLTCFTFSVLLSSLSFLFQSSPFVFFTVRLLKMFYNIFNLHNKDTKESQPQKKKVSCKHWFLRNKLLAVVRMGTITNARATILTTHADIISERVGHQNVA